MRLKVVPDDRGLNVRSAVVEQVRAAEEVEGRGVVVPPGDSKAFAEAIKELVDAPLRRERLGKAARARAEEAFSKESILFGVCDGFVSIMKGST